MTGLWISLTLEWRDLSTKTLNSDPVVARHSFTQGVEKSVDNQYLRLIHGAQALKAKKIASAIR